MSSITSEYVDQWVSTLESSWMFLENEGENNVTKIRRSHVLFAPWLTPHPYPKLLIFFHLPESLEQTFTTSAIRYYRNLYVDLFSAASVLLRQCIYYTHSASDIFDKVDREKHQNRAMAQTAPRYNSTRASGCR